MELIRKIFRNSHFKLILRVLTVVIILPCIGFLAVGYICMNDLLFPHPHTGKLTGNMTLRSGEFQLDAFYQAPPPGRPVILFSHGNGEILAYVKPFLQEMIQNRYGVMTYDYAGFGGSEGKPDERQSCMDIEAAFQYLTETEKIDPRRIVIFGFSLGGGPSCHLASKHPECHLVLAATFASAIQVVLPFSLPGDRFPNAKILRRTPSPVLIFHGTADKVIPIRNGRKNYDSAIGRKKFISVSGADHNDLFDQLKETFWTELENFISADNSSIF